jgi:hypothetical protein
MNAPAPRVFWCLLAGVMAPAPVSAAPRVAVCAADADAETGIVASLRAGGDFDSVDYVDCANDAPSAATLTNADAVLVYSSDFFADPIGTGDRLADFVDEGGGVVVALFAMYTANGLTGRFFDDDYFCMEHGPTRSEGTLASQPEVSGTTMGEDVTSLQATYRSGSDLNTSRNARSLWNWTDGVPAICEMTIGDARRIDLGFVPNATQYTGNGVELVRNALLHVTPVPPPGTREGDTRSATPFSCRNSAPGGVSQIVLLLIVAGFVKKRRTTGVLP